HHHHSLPIQSSPNQILHHRKQTKWRSCGGVLPAGSSVHFMSPCSVLKKERKNSSTPVFMSFCNYCGDPPEVARKS
ncbi:unnamed protein product, partial [Ixodes persulcatus]